MRASLALALAIACAPLVAHAQGQPPADAGVAAPDAAQPPPPEDKPAPPTPEELAQRIQDLEDKQAQLERQQATNEGTREQVKQLMPLASFIKVFVDVGAFAVAGNGSGIRSDLGNLYYPKYAGPNGVAGQWVFMGDPLATAINSLGEPADTGDSRELKTDTLHAGGHPSAIVNSVGLAIGKYIDHGISISALAELLPRPNQNILDIELANIQWRPYEDLDLVIIAGKIDSVLGIEYRSQDAPRRLEVTPSLICRYTCGRPLGIESRLVRGPLSVSASLTNGDSFMNRFEPETLLHANDWPTAAGHVQWLLPVGSGLEVGVSGAIGPQDKQPDTDIYQWHVGFDAWLHDLAGFEATAEYVKGLQQGKTTSTTPCDAAPCLTYQGAYLRVDRRVNNWLIPYVRFDWRDAVHQNGAIFVYESHVTRVTLGAHFEWTPRIIGKIEYTFIRELDPIPDFPDDVITTSIVVATD